MACSSNLITKDFFMKAENNKSSDEQELCREHANENDRIFQSVFERVATPNDEEKESSLKSTNDENMSQSVCLFRKYLLSRSQSSMAAKTTMEAEAESRNIKKHSSPRPLLPPKFLGSNSYRPRNRLSLLEQQLLPGLMRCGDQSNKTSTAEQLTIFYDGTINVYDNIPSDQAQAIMRLASENSSAKPIVADRLKTDGRKPSLGPKVLSISTLRAGLPLARRHSLQCFLEKRRNRIINNSPYAIHSETKAGNETSMNNGSNERFSLTPFPSRLGYFSPKSASQSSC